MKYLFVPLTFALFLVAAPARAGEIQADSYASGPTINHLWFNGSGGFSFEDRAPNGTTVLGDAVIQITNPSTSAGLLGTIGGSYSIGAISTASGGGVTVESADVTPVSGPPGTTDKLTFTDGNGKVFSGDVSFLEIATTQLSPGSSQGGGIDGNATVNLTNVTYNGTNPDLQAFLGSGGTASVDFGFTATQDLKYLSKHAANTPFTATLDSAAVPEPASLTLLGLGACGLLGYTARRRKAVAG